MDGSRVAAGRHLLPDGAVFGFVLRLRGVMCLHASAVRSAGRPWRFSGRPGRVSQRRRPPSRVRALRSSPMTSCPSPAQRPMFRRLGIRRPEAVARGISGVERDGERTASAAGDSPGTRVFTST